MTPLLHPFYSHSRAGMVILTILSLAKVIVLKLCAYHPLAAGLLYLTRSAPFLYWALLTQYPYDLSSPSAPWYMTAASHERFALPLCPRSSKSSKQPKYQASKGIKDSATTPKRVKKPAKAKTPSPPTTSPSTPPPSSFPQADSEPTKKHHTKKGKAAKECGDPHVCCFSGED
ncbi:hypothetical protein DSO57_1006976 [Entomophthora muscae]|uniref:Uncharacterized protein n=1 Tax=Entomophthora muscae TaxID=34485 RepID=A0ACC2UH50_9FUNG|nr:hypothetical protein DSO57_1006976 [Entomophthora muscae]